MTAPDSPLGQEIAHRQAIGQERVSVAEFARRFAALGYQLDRSLDCRGMARYLESGRAYPSCDTGLKEADTGLSAWNYQARRDASFARMQELRCEIFAVTRGAILEV